jgi:hypothetical protein
MELGGNLPESLLPYTMLGHESIEEHDVKTLSIPEMIEKKM